MEKKTEKNKEKVVEEKSSLKWWVLATVMIGTLLGRLDQSVVNLALPKIINEFGITVTAAGWIATAYIIANAVFVPVWGKLGDTIGRKRVYIWGFGIFIFGSVLAGFAWNLNSLLVFRVIQAIASSADYPTAMAIIAVTFREGRQRAQALGIWSASFAAGAILGPLIGGPLIDGFGWRAVFLVNLPIGLIGLFMALRFVKESVSMKKTVEFDLTGALTLGVFLSALVLVLDKGNDWGWASFNSIFAYTISIIFVLIFILLERRHKDPLIDFKFFKNKIFMSALTNNFIVFMAMMGAVFLIPLFAQTFLGYSATQTGYLFIPLALMMMISAQIGGRMIGKYRPNHIIAVSTFIAAIGIFLFYFFLDPRASAIDIIIPLSVFAFGMGFGMAQRTNAVAIAVPQEEIGVASSVLALARNIAGAFGIAIFTTILNSSIESAVLNTARNSIINVHTPTVISQAVGLIILHAQIIGFRTVFLVASGVILIGAIVAVFTNMGNLKKDVVVHMES